MNLRRASLLVSITLCLVLFALPALAHEVYVLPHAEVERAMSTPGANPIEVMEKNMSQFIFWAIASVVAVVGVFLISITRLFENRLDPILMRLKRHAPKVVRVTLGLGLLASAFYGSLFGPELPFEEIFGAFSPFASLLFGAAGVCMIMGRFVRASAIAVFAVYAAGFMEHGHYMLTYAGYIGAVLAVLFAQSHGSHKYAPLALRVFFGISLIYASAYAKIMHSDLAFTTVTMYHLNEVLPFEPNFLVLGASIIEMLAGVFFILGLEIRFIAVFLEIMIFTSLAFFGEVLWPHLILIGIPIALIFYGYDKYSLEGRFFKKRGQEPVL